MFRRLIPALSALALAACSVAGERTAEEPKYTVAGRIGDVEIRQYGPRIAAETVVRNEEREARSDGFRLLADYIFGNNQGGAKIAMTAPVAQEAAGSSIAMTAPVAQQKDVEGNWRIRFFMPASYTMATLPKPNNPKVALTTVAPETMAVLRFTGSTAPEAVAARTTELVAALERSAWRPAGPPMAWFYDPPWTLPNRRRNEVAIPVSPN